MAGDIYCANDGIVFADGTVLNTARQLGLRNKIIDGNFALNLSAVTSPATIGANVFGHTMWFGGAAGCTYSFATSGNINTVTITAGTLKQVIEGNRLQSGQHVLSWVGTAQARIDGGAWGNSGMLGTAVGGTNQVIEFGPGTVSLVQYERGNKPTPYHFVGEDFDELLSQRYFVWMPVHMINVSTSAGGILAIPIRFPTRMRAVPTLSAVIADPDLTQSSSSTAGVVSSLVTRMGAMLRLDASALSVAFYLTGYRIAADARLTS